MDNTTTNAEVQEEKENRGRGLIIILFVIIALLAALAGYLFFQLNDLKKQTETLKVQKAEVDKDIEDYRARLQELSAKYDSLIAAHEGLRAELTLERDKVTALYTDYQRLKASGEGAASTGGKSLRAKLEEMQQTLDENLAVIADLKAKNQDLTNENFRAVKELEETNAQNGKLTQENSKLTKTVEVAKRLKTYELYADAVRLSKGGTKEKQTDKASKADRLRVCFTVLDNQIADKQEKLLYAVIKDPDRKTFTQGDKSKITLLKGDEISYSIKKEIFYDNKVMQLCMNWDLSQEEKLKAGKYVVEIYAEGVLIGSTDFELN